MSFFSRRRSQSLPAEQGLFIIGAARSGSTILQNALNDSPCIFLFGEANFHRDQGTPDFAARFNAFHRFWANQETKSSFCPPVLAFDAPWQNYFRHLAQHHRYVGAKTVINPSRPADFIERLFRFHCQLFYTSRVIFTFRDPLATILSTRDLQMLLVGQTAGLPAIMQSYVDTVRLFVRMVRTLPYVRAICHEDVSRDSFVSLENWLGVPLPNSHSYYDRGRVLAYNDSGLDDQERRQIEPILGLYEKLRHEATHGFATPQLDQNNNHLSPSHFTRLGHISRNADAIAAQLATAQS
jgi:hypothetical protein